MIPTKIWSNASGRWSVLEAGAQLESGASEYTPIGELYQSVNGTQIYYASRAAATHRYTLLTEVQGRSSIIRLKEVLGNGAVYLSGILLLGESGGSVEVPTAARECFVDGAFQVSCISPGLELYQLSVPILMQSLIGGMVDIPYCLMAVINPVQSAPGMDIVTSDGTWKQHIYPYNGRYADASTILLPAYMADDTETAEKRVYVRFGMQKDSLSLDGASNTVTATGIAGQPAEHDITSLVDGVNTTFCAALTGIRTLLSFTFRRQWSGGSTSTTYQLPVQAPGYQEEA